MVTHVAILVCGILTHTTNAEIRLKCVSVFIFSNRFILARAAVDPKPIMGTLHTRQEYTLHRQGTIYTHIPT